MRPNQPENQPSIIYCDGACSGNPGPGGWGTVVVDHKGDVEEMGGFDPATTNNRMEMLAAIAGLSRLEATQSRTIELYTDSTYVIRGITQWVHGWKNRGWTTSQGEPVANQDLWEELDQLTSTLKPSIKWLYVRGHQGNPGNERVDAIAVAFSKQKSIDLYKGPLQHYSVDLLSGNHQGVHPDNMSKSPGSSRSAKSSSKTAGAYYISFVDRIFQKHTTWKDCESRVKGRTGAKFKKITSAEEELDYRTKWGVPPSGRS